MYITSRISLKILHDLIESINYFHETLRIRILILINFMEITINIKTTAWNKSIAGYICYCKMAHLSIF